MSRKYEPFDDVKKPRGYNSHPSGIETIEVNEWFTGNVAAAIKYVWRKDHKEPVPLRDLRKCAWYLEREQQRLQDPLMENENATYFVTMSNEVCERLGARITRVVMADVPGALLSSVLSELWTARDSFVLALGRALIFVRAAIEAAEKAVSP